MVRRSVRLFALVLLASCAQTPTAVEPDPAPSMPTTLSTNFTDNALQVVTAADRGAYVLGHRNVERASDGLSVSGQVFVARLGVKGNMLWLTALPRGVVRDTSMAATDNAVYVLTQLEIDQPLYLHKLGPDGRLLWSRVVFETLQGTSSLLASSNGQLYFSRTTTDGTQILTALDAEGNVLWEKEGRDSPAAVGADGSVYINRFQAFSKYAADGTLLWSQALEPSVPGFDEFGVIKGQSSEVVVRGDYIYAIMTYPYNAPDGSEELAWNTEIRRYAEDGTRTWTKLLYPERTGTAYAESIPVGVAPSGSLFVLQREAMDANPDLRALRFSPGGKLSGGVLESFGDSIADFALTEAAVTGSENLPPTTAFYAVGSTGQRPCRATPCPANDAYLSQYSVNELSSVDGTYVDTYINLEWSIR